MAEINRAGSAVQTTQQQSILEAGKAAAKDKVSAGQLAGDNIRVSSQEAQSAALRGSQAQRPELDTPQDLSPAQMEAANAQMAEVGELTDQALANTKELLTNILDGSVTPEQTARLQKHAASLQGASEYLENLQGKGLNTPQGKRSVLAAMGFNDAQLEALLSLANPDDANNALASLHGGQGVLDQKKSALRSLGFSDSQIDALLSMANPDEDGNGLVSLHQAGSNPKTALEALGFKGAQVDRLLALLSGQAKTAEFAEQQQLLTKMGFSDAEIETILLAGDPRLLKQQKALIQSSSPQTVSLLQANSTGLNLLSQNNIFDQKILEQLVDIFAVMELLHKMSVAQRRSAREFRSVEYEAAKNEILNQAGEMKKAALLSAIGGWVSAGTKIAGGVAQGGLAMKSGNAQNQGALQQQVALANGVSQVITASGDMVKAGMDYQAGMHQAQVKLHEAFQKTHDNAAQSESEFMNMHGEMIRTVNSKMDEIIRSWFETLKTTTRA
ncbi:hypothetical protein [Endozoicomonas sp.]|uniref:hypothetical protein n=1 Tax=Endozoicomonas sp. TaxID=1892382 RepID=UPI0028851233|nr:hypothetical protein [Endozoicomonas sp.]